MTIIAGVDAGGSHTEAAVSDGSDTPGARSRGGPGSTGPGRVERSARVILKTLSAALAEAGASKAEGLVVGCAGAGDTRERDELQVAISQGGLALKVQVVTDGEIALASVFESEQGILLSAGPGSIAYAVDDAGTTYRVGGHGKRFGDEGSAFAIARSAIGAALRAGESRGEPTTLTQRLADAVAGRRGTPLDRWIRTADTDEVAMLAWAVADAAASGDAIAGQIIEQAATDLAAHVGALRRRLPAGQTVPVAFNGGLLRPQSPLRKVVVAAIESSVADVELREDSVDPVRGALRLASRLTHAS